MYQVYGPWPRGTTIAFLNATIAMIAVWWPTYACVVRGLVLELREREFVLAIFTAIMGFNFFGDALRDALAPRMR